MLTSLECCGETVIINETWLMPVIHTTNIFAVRLQGIKFVPSLSWVCKRMQKLYIRPTFIKIPLFSQIYTCPVDLKIYFWQKFVQSCSSATKSFTFESLAVICLWSWPTYFLWARLSLPEKTNTCFLAASSYPKFTHSALHPSRETSPNNF